MFKESEKRRTHLLSATRTWTLLPSLVVITTEEIEQVTSQVFLSK